MVISSIELQSHFEKFAEPLIQKMAINEVENHQLASFRDWLLPLLMNGQVRVDGGVYTSDDLKSSDVLASGKLNRVSKASYEVSGGMDVAAEPERN